MPQVHAIRRLGQCLPLLILLASSLDRSVAITAVEQLRMLDEHKGLCSVLHAAIMKLTIDQHLPEMIELLSAGVDGVSQLTEH
jgi:hypothetical protein